MINKFYLSDRIYDAREQSYSIPPEVEDYWDHPHVLKFAEAVETMKNYLKENKSG
jgi:hypothetical protein